MFAESWRRDDLCGRKCEVTVWDFVFIQLSYDHVHKNATMLMMRWMWCSMHVVKYCTRLRLPSLTKKNLGPFLDQSELSLRLSRCELCRSRKMFRRIFKMFYSHVTLTWTVLLYTCFFVLSCTFRVFARVEKSNLTVLRQQKNYFRVWVAEAAV